MIESNYIIIIIILVLVVLYNTYQIANLEDQIKSVEGFDAAEALANIASVYNQSRLRVTDLEVTGNLTVTGNSTVGGNSTVSGNSNVTGKVTAGSGKLGLYEIRGDRIGIPDRGDIQIGADKWCRLFDYDGSAYAGAANGAGGFAGMNLWCSNGRLTANNINGMTPAYKNQNLRIKYGSRYLKSCGDGDNDKCGSNDPWASWGSSSYVQIV